MNEIEISDSVARLIYGSVDDLKSMLPHEADRGILERALSAARQLREGKTKVQMIERAIKKLPKK